MNLSLPPILTLHHRLDQIVRLPFVIRRTRSSPTTFVGEKLQSGMSRCWKQTSPRHVSAKYHDVHGSAGSFPLAVLSVPLHELVLPDHVFALWIDLGHGLLEFLAAQPHAQFLDELLGLRVGCVLQRACTSGFEPGLPSCPSHCRRR